MVEAMSEKSFKDYSQEELREIFEENYKWLVEKFEESDNPKREFWVRIFTKVADFDPAFVARNLESLVASFSTFMKVNKEVKNQDEEIDEPILYDHLTERDLEEIQRRWGVSNMVFGMGA